jgi:osmoprotectant transport system substrate-binding protein/osmoprotectant transport system permease protein
LILLRILVATLILISAGCSQDEDSGSKLKIGSKKFTESVILGEVLTQLAMSQGTDAEHLKELGGTRVLWNALKSGDIDIYPEYTGTIVQEILSHKNIQNEDGLTKELAKQGIKISAPLGFNNTYALGMKKELAQRLGIKTISDLRNHPGLRFGFTNEFLNRGDGWPSLRTLYNLPQKNVTGLDHDLAYRGLEGGSIDLIDLYSTDAEIHYYDLEVLEDDLSHFSQYNAVILYREELEDTHPEELKAILSLEGRLAEDSIIGLNASVKLNGVPEGRAAQGFLKNKMSIETEAKSETFLSRLRKNTLQHLFLVSVSLAAAIIISIPLGIIAYKVKKVGQLVLGIVGIIQTLPSLALLVFMIPFFGIGTVPAIVALFLYSLLPIVRNTYSGLHDIPADLRESAEALGLSSVARLRLIEMPLAARSILSGIKTSAVINVGTATLGALIGAGGYGQPILTGIRLDNVGLILEGAIPAAVLALLVQGMFDLLERFLVPGGLRLKKS